MIDKSFLEGFLQKTTSWYHIFTEKCPKNNKVEVDMCYYDFLLAEKQIELFRLNPFSHFLLAEKQIENCFHPIPFTRHKWTLLGSVVLQNLTSLSQHRPRKPKF